uniref:Choline/carnitine acyltransferase domain-containing protein n=1 Tax=Plectus sambesii TaxID=2011161 RepID=A0A914X199_9BILA
MGYFTNKVTQQPIHKLSVADYRPQDWTDYHYNRFRNKVWPLSAHSLLCTIGVISFLHFEAVNPSFGAIDYIQENFFPPIVGRNIVTLALSVVLFAVFVWFVFDQTLRYLISFALRYKGWVYDPVGRPSVATRIYMLFIKLLQRRETLFFSYQGVLPTLPLPTLQATVDKYLKSMRALLSDEEFDRQKKLADDFLSKGTATSLQMRLHVKWLSSKNYVTDWWKEIVYMRHRGSLIKTNMAGVDVIFRRTTHLPAARAANLVVCNRMFENEIIHQQTMKPVTAGGVPLCAMQYQDFHRTLRVPGVETDHMIKLDETARHVAVYCKGCWYKVNIFAGDRLLKASEIERAFQMIIDSKPDPSPGEEHLSALTGGERAVWAKIRSEEFSSGLNKDALDAIESALDVIWFDEEFRNYDETALLH